MSASLNDPILIEDLEENLDDDPYGTAMYVIANTLYRALGNDAMSQREADNLSALVETIKSLDPTGAKGMGLN